MPSETVPISCDASSTPAAKDIQPALVDGGQENTDAQEEKDDASNQPQEDVGPVSQDPAHTPESAAEPTPANDNDSAPGRSSPTAWLHNSTTSAICFGISAAASAADQRASAIRVFPAPLTEMSVKPAVPNRPAMMSLLAKLSSIPSEMVAR